MAASYAASYIDEYKAAYESYTGVSATSSMLWTLRTEDELIECNARQLAFWSLRIDADILLDLDEESMMRQMFVRNARNQALSSLQCRYPDKIIKAILERERELVAAHSTKSVLHVDGKEKRRGVMSKILAACGVVAVVSVEGSKALDAMKRNEYDLVIVDLEMPSDGREMIMAFRAWEEEHAKRHRQRIVCLSAQDLFSDEEILGAGFDGVVRKPITKAKIDELLHGRA